MEKTTSAFKVLLLFIISLSFNNIQAEENITFYHYDLLGSPVATTNEMGEVTWREEYTPYGKKQLNQDSNTDNVRGYTGHVHDSETSLTYMQARYYDPEIGRFMGIDPIGFKAKNPISFNRYAYANNNPYKYVDPNGEEPYLGWDSMINNAYSKVGYGISQGWQYHPAILVGTANIGSIASLSRLIGSSSKSILGFTSKEASIMFEAKSILSSAEIGTLKASHAANKGATVNINGRMIQYEPNLPASGMTMFGENGFIIGKEAFTSNKEFTKTVLHELHRLETSASSSGASQALVTKETKDAFNFAEKAAEELSK